LPFSHDASSSVFPESDSRSILSLSSLLFDGFVPALSCSLFPLPFPLMMLFFFGFGQEYDGTRLFLSFLSRQSGDDLNPLLLFFPFSCVLLFQFPSCRLARRDASHPHAIMRRNSKPPPFSFFLSLPFSPSAIPLCLPCAKVVVEITSLFSFPFRMCRNRLITHLVFLSFFLLFCSLNSLASCVERRCLSRHPFCFSPFFPLFLPDPAPSLQDDSFFFLSFSFSKLFFPL